MLLYLQPVLQLQFNGTKTFLKLNDNNIDWGGSVNSSNTVPPNMPVCGYLGDRGPCAAGEAILNFLVRFTQLDNSFRVP